MSAATNPYEPPRGDPWYAESARPTGRVFDDQPVVIFETVLTEGWFLRCHKQGARLILSNPLHQQKLVRWIGGAFAAVLGLGALSLFVTDSHSRPIVGSATAFAAVVAASIAALKWRRSSLMAAQFRRSTVFNTTLKVALYREGLAMEGIITTMTKKWCGFAIAGRSPDGIVLLDDKSQLHWLPFADLARGTAANAEELVRQSVAIFRVINKV